MGFGQLVVGIQHSGLGLYYYRYTLVKVTLKGLLGLQSVQRHFHIVLIGIEVEVPDSVGYKLR